MTTLDHSKCVVCESGDNRLRFLACLHSCCDDCLRQGDSIKCPICFKITSVYDEVNLKEDFIQRELNLRSKLAEPRECVMCQPYGKTNIGSYICPECQGAPLCEFCLKAHRVLPALKAHEAIPLSDLFDAQYEDRVAAMMHSEPTCARHHKEKAPRHIRHYCQTCKRPACKTCLVEEHKKGKHQVIPIEKHAEAQTVDLGKAQHFVHDRKSDIVSRLELVKARSDERKANEKQIRKQIEKRAAALKRVFSEQLDRAKDERLSRVDNLSLERDQMEEDQRGLLQDALQNTDLSLALSADFQRWCSVSSAPEDQEFVAEQLRRSFEESNAVLKKKPPGYDKITFQEPEDVLGSDFAGEILGLLLLPGETAPVMGRGEEETSTGPTNGDRIKENISKVV